MLPERLILLSTAQGLEFSDVPGGDRPEWTVEDLGMALKGLDKLYFKAFTYRWAADDSGKKFLQKNLYYEAIKIAIREKWPNRIAGNGHYISDLVDMCLQEERHPHVFRVSILWPSLMDVELGVWQKSLSGKYELIRMMFEAWVSIAHHHMLELLLECEELT